MRLNGADLTSDLVKVAHHGSINASPDWSYQAVFPEVKATNAAIFSTDPERYKTGNEVPKGEVLAGWMGRLETPQRLLRTDDEDLGVHVELSYWGKNTSS